MKLYNLTSSILNSVKLFFPEIQNKKIEDCVFCTYSTSNIFVMTLTFYMWNFEISGFETKLKKLITFLQREGISDAEDLLGHKYIDDADDINISYTKNNYREYYFQIPMNIALNLET